MQPAEERRTEASLGEGRGEQKAANLKRMAAGPRNELWRRAAGPAGTRRAAAASAAASPGAHSGICKKARPAVGPPQCALPVAKQDACPGTGQRRHPAGRAGAGPQWLIAGMPRAAAAAGAHIADPGA